MIKRILLALLILVSPSWAACHTVSPSGSGTHSGADWNNAMVNLPATLTRGDVYYLADGQYGSFTFSQSGTAAVEIRKAQTYDNCTSTGWNASTMGSAQAVFATNRQFSILSTGLIINGNGQQTAAGCGGAVGSSPTATLTTVTDCGIKIDNSSSCATDGVSDSAEVIGWTMEYIDYLGCGNATSENFMIREDNSVGSVVTHMYLHNFGSVCAVVGGASNFTFTLNYMFRNQVVAGSDPAHGQCLQSGGDSGNFTVSRNVFRDLGGTAIMMAWVGSGTTLSGPYQFFDNVIWNTPGFTPLFPSANGLLACINGFTCNGVTMSQNTIALMPSGAQTGIDSETGGNFTVQNNIWYDDAVTGDLNGAGTFTETNNSYLVSGTSCPSGTANVCNNTSSNPFVSSSTGNFALVSDGANWNNRTTLASPFTTDMVSNTFTSDRGAFQSVGTTWYIRPDGGTNAQCTGKTNAAYPGSGSAQACAFSHPYWMMTSGEAWANFVGGDTIQFVNTSGTSDTYLMGEKNNGIGFDWNGAGINTGECPAPNSGSAAAGCILPTIPSGTASQHTRILGQNVGSCHDSSHTHLVNPTILSGISGAFAVLDVRATEYVDLDCIAVTQNDSCTHIAISPGQCNTSTSNYAQYGLLLNYEPGTPTQGPSNLTVTDFAAVGLSNSGVLGSAINTLSSDVTSFTDLYVIGNGIVGFNADSGGCNESCEDIGTVNVSHSTFDWNGCNPATMPYNFTLPDTAQGFTNCTDQTTSGGNGDGFVTIAANNVSLNVDHSFFRWNTQDGFDSLHLSDDQTHSPSISINTSWSEGNEGQTFKLGAGATSTAINNVSINNCLVLGTASNFPLNPTGWNTALIGSPNLCRASRDEWAFQLNNTTVLTLENNTSVGYGTTMYDLECSGAPGEGSCAAGGAKVIFNNNISLGFPDPGNSNRLPSGFFFGTGVTAAVFSGGSKNNLWNNMFSTTGCPDSVISPTPTNSQCGDPLLVGESNINAINPNLTSSSPAIAHGEFISGITTDYNGATRPNPPAIGALEFVGVAPPSNLTVGGSAKTGGRSVY